MTEAQSSRPALQRLRRVLSVFVERVPRLAANPVVCRILARPAPLRFQESALAHKYLDSLKGIEIGGSAHNPFGLDAINLDYTSDMNAPFKELERQLCGDALRVDLVATAEALPLKDKSVDFVLSSHVIEHLADPIGALQEWQRVARKYVFIIFPHPDRTPETLTELTTVAELIDRNAGRRTVSADPAAHKSVWILSSFLELMAHLKYVVVETQDPDDKVGNGTTVVIKCEP